MNKLCRFLLFSFDNKYSIITGTVTAHFFSLTRYTNVLTLTYLGILLFSFDTGGNNF